MNHTAHRARRNPWIGLGLVAIPACAILVAASRPGRTAEPAVVRSPMDVAYSSDGRTLAVADRTAGQVVFVTGGKPGIRAQVSEPTGLAWTGPNQVAVTSYSTRSLALVSTGGQVTRRIGVGVYPVNVAVSKGRALVANTGSRDVSIVNLASGRETARIATGGEPSAVAIAPDGRTAIAANLIPVDDATDAANAARIIFVDMATGKKTGGLRLESGSANVRAVAFSPDGRWAYIAHALGRFNLPTTQLDRGWVNTNAFTILDMKSRTLYATALLDHPMEGGADPWGLALSRDGRTAWVALSGVHQLARIDLRKLHGLLEGKIPEGSPLNRPSDEWSATARPLWLDIKADPTQRKELVNDLSAMFVGEVLDRSNLPGKGPRGISLSPDGKKLAVAEYFSGNLAMVDTSATDRIATISLGAQPPMTQARKGEQMFHDANLCFQHWLSCSTCHPDVRADGLNWDLLNDGIGNPKNTRSLLNAHRRGLMMSHGIRSDYKVAVVAGFRFILFREPEKGEPETVQAFLRSLQPRTSPHRSLSGALSASAQRGDVIFHSKIAQCSSCHLGELHLDNKIHDVGTRGPFDSDSKFITPTLTEVWRTPPYLHDGRALSVLEVITKFNKADKHGTTSHLTKAQLNDLAEYVLSL